MKKLNKDKPHYHVSGHGCACFEQDGLLFDDEGCEVVEVAGEESASVVTDEAAAALVEELGQLKDLLAQKEGTLGELTEKVAALEKNAEEFEGHFAEANRKLKQADDRYEEEVSRADGLQKKVSELEKQLADVDFPAPPGDGKAAKK